MPTTFDVRIWQPRVFKGVKKTTYNLRWVVGPKTHTKTFATKALAESSRAALNVAARRGETFDIDSDLPLEHESGKPGATERLQPGRGLLHGQVDQARSQVPRAAY